MAKHAPKNENAFSTFSFMYLVAAKPNKEITKANICNAISLNTILSTLSQQLTVRRLPNLQKVHQF